MTPTQSMAARGLLKWTRKDLAVAADVSEWSVRRFEEGHDVGARTIRRIQRAFDPLVGFISEDKEWGEGVRLRKGAAQADASEAEKYDADISTDSSDISNSPFNDPVRGPVARAVFQRGRWFSLPRQTRRILRAWLFTDRYQGESIQPLE